MQVVITSCWWQRKKMESMECWKRLDPTCNISDLTCFKWSTILSPEFEKTFILSFLFTFLLISIETSAFCIISVSLYPLPIANTEGLPTRFLIKTTIAPFCFGDNPYPNICLLNAKMNVKCSSMIELCCMISNVLPQMNREICLFLSTSFEKTLNPTLLRFLFCR